MTPENPTNPNPETPPPRKPGRPRKPQPASLDGQVANLSRQGALEPGNLETLQALPPELAAQLSPRDARLVLALVNGCTWAQALDTLGVKQASRLRKRFPAPPPIVRKAAELIVSQLAESAGVNRLWIIKELVLTYRRASSAEPVLDRSGVETGVYRVDGATARSCLELLGRDLGMFGARAAGPGIPTDQVADLMRAVAARGRPGLVRESPAPQRETQALDP